MVTVNHNYLKLPGSYLFSTIGKKVRAYKEENPDKEVISLGIGDVTQPLVPAIIDALHGAVEEMAHAETFHGYAPDLGYEFLRRAIAKNDYQDRGCNIAADEIFVSDVNQLLEVIMKKTQEHIGKLPEQMTRDDKIEFVRLLNEKGAFLITKSGERVQEYLGISKYTLYNYLDITKNQKE